MQFNRSISEELVLFRSQLRENSVPYKGLLQLTVWRPLVDTVADCLLVACAVAAVAKFGVWLVPLAIVVIANRQRALGNILHDAAHRNLHHSRAINDSIAQWILAPLALVDLQHYREVHFRHHLQLGDRERDPDYLSQRIVWPGGWIGAYVGHLTSLTAWWSSFAGHVGSNEVDISSKAKLVCWWCTAGGLLWFVGGNPFFWWFVLLWLGARATVFHAITTFREMCDHYGLRAGGVASFTRDISGQSLWRWLIHPHNNGYHLTHHLLPTLPYYKLPEAHRLFSGIPFYRNQAQVCSSYISGGRSVVTTWNTGENQAWNER